MYNKFFNYQTKIVKNFHILTKSSFFYAKICYQNIKKIKKSSPLFPFSVFSCYFCSQMKTNQYQHERYDHYEVTQELPLLEWLLENVKQSRSKIKSTLQGRGVKVNGRVVTQFDFSLTRGMRVSVSKTKKNDTFKSRYVKVVYEDRHLVVVEKNIGILSMAAGRRTLNVKSVLDDYFKRTHQKCTAHVVHRLDRDTSGLMVYAKSMDVRQLFEQDWHRLVYDRRYVAVVSGEMEEDEGRIESWMKENRDYFIVSSPVDNGGKHAITHFHTLRRASDFSLVEFRLETGRKNQIRVHTADMGHPVCGDAKYGNGHDPAHRLCLHAYLLCFFHPVTHERMEFELPLPASFLKLFK